MYRVELKDGFAGFGRPVAVLVPNVPCGVESTAQTAIKAPKITVPNVPCGVESVKDPQLGKVLNQILEFLMYRVELKECSLLLSRLRKTLLVPNVPCGVERQEPFSPSCVLFLPFLMYRVELKENQVALGCFCLCQFLMYRVELKVYLAMGRP